MQIQPHPSTPKDDAAFGLRSILVVEGDGDARSALTILLKQRGYEPTCVTSSDAAFVELQRRAFDAVVIDRALVTHALIASATSLVLAEIDAFDDAVPLLGAGAYMLVRKPIHAAELAAALRNVDERLRLRARAEEKARKEVSREASASLLLGASAPMQEVLRTIKKIAEHKTTVLITGESGTGKELVARAIHAASPRSAGPFVAVNCGAIPEALLESELFGHKQGAFTDAVRDKRGLFSEASNGTLFLDEIGEMPIAPQVKLLRALQEQIIRPVGSTEDERVDVRVVAATMRDLQADVKAGRFREDLFYRLNVIQVELPSLRERREDLPQLIEHFLQRTNARLGTRVKKVAPDAMRMLAAYAWPGNVRELENTIERSVVLCEGDTLTAAGLPDRIAERRDPVREALHDGELSIKKTVRVIEEELIRRALTACGGNRTNASKKLEISHRALLYKMKEFGIVDPPARTSRTSHVEKFDGEG